jgi:hypothetical protein
VLWQGLHQHDWMAAAGESRNRPGMTVCSCGLVRNSYCSCSDRGCWNFEVVNVYCLMCRSEELCVWTFVWQIRSVFGLSFCYTGYCSCCLFPSELGSVSGCAQELRHSMHLQGCSTCWASFGTFLVGRCEPVCCVFVSIRLRSFTCGPLCGRSVVLF